MKKKQNIPIIYKLIIILLVTFLTIGIVGNNMVDAAKDYTLSWTSDDKDTVLVENSSTGERFTVTAGENINVPDMSVKRSVIVNNLNTGEVREIWSNEWDYRFYYSYYNELLEKDRKDEFFNQFENIVNPGDNSSDGPGQEGSGEGSGESDYKPTTSDENNSLDNNYWGNFVTQADAKYPNTVAPTSDAGIEIPMAVKKVMDESSGKLIPERNTSGPSGMLPQYFKQNPNNPKRELTLEEYRFESNTSQWVEPTTGNVVFCAKFNATVRYGNFDPDKYYYDLSGISLLNESTIGVQESIGAYSFAHMVEALKITLKEAFRYNGPRYVTKEGYYIDDSEFDWTPRASVHYARPSLRAQFDGNYDPEDPDWEDELSVDELLKYYRENKYPAKYFKMYKLPNGKEIENWGDAVGEVNIEITDTVPDNLDNSICYPIMAAMDLPNSGQDQDGMRLSYVFDSVDDAKDWAKTEALKIGGNLLNAMNTGVTGQAVSSDIDPENPWKAEIVAKDGGVAGPDVVVLETEDHKSNGYVKVKDVEYKNDAKAYIFSAYDNAYNAKDNYKSKYTLNDEQGAFWKVLKDEGGRNPDGSHKLTANAVTLYSKARDYEKFNKEGFKASIISQNAQVIADRANKKYIVGPYKIDYTQYDDISYVKSIYLDTDKGQMIYDETHNDIQVVMDGQGVTGSNGLLKEYPKKNQSFFVVFDAEKAGFPTEVTLNAKFEYIEETHAEGMEIDSDARVYQYFAHCSTGDSENYNMDKYTITIKATANVGQREFDYDFTEKSGSYRHTWHYYNENMEIYNKTFDVYFPYIKMDEDWKYNKDAQELMVILDGEVRTVKINPKETTTVEEVPVEENVEVPGTYRIYGSDKASVKIDLTMELGGFVWLDEDGGKESISNGQADNGEKRIPNMKVTLEAVNANNAKGTATQTTTTDSNGTYRFKGLNAMFQYRFTFLYNAQYYEPTTWQPASTWGTEKWNVNSNAKDNIQEREQYNLGFKVIGAKRGTYAEDTSTSDDNVAMASIAQVSSRGDNKSYTRDELKQAGVIDEFALPTGSSNSSMQHYVEDCMLNAYTCGETNSTNPDGLYPYPSLFVIDKNPVTREYVECFHNQPSRLYDSAYYINLGLSERQQSDLAVKKDVDHVTLEINGQSHTYKYDSLETQINEDESWTIGVRTSDAFKNNYGTSYTRELYKSDYLYKASNYGDAVNSLGKDKSDELEVYITYKIMVRNQSLSLRMRVDELVDYYDEDLQYIDERSYIEIKQSRDDSAKKGIYPVKADYDPASENSNSLYAKDSIPGYNNLYVRGLGQLNADKNSLENYLAAGQTAYVYLTFRVKKDTMDGEDWVKLDEEIQSGNPVGVGKENIVEINGYSTQYAKGTQVPNKGDVSFEPAGILDRDSSSGNVTEAIKQKDIAADSQELNKLEDDTGKAPNIRIILYRDDNQNRVIAGNIFEDLRTQSIDLTTTGDGIKDDKEPSINGVTVQLVEIMENGEEYVWREFGDNAPKTAGIGGTNTIGKGTGSGTVQEETPIINKYNLVENYKFETNHDGDYAFKSFMPGKYVIRYIYGDTVRTVVPKSLGGLNEKSYNGQDYKSTTYQKGIDQNLNVPSRDQNTWVNTASNLVYIWRENSTWAIGQETLGKTLTQVATIKVDASNNERVTLPKAGAEMIDVNAQNGYLYDITASDANANVSDAKDIESRRNIVNNYSSNGVTNYIAEVLASHKNDYTPMNDRDNLLKDLITNTQMTAETGLMVIDLEYDTEATAFEQPANGQYTTTEQGKFKILNVNLGLEERPKAQVEIEKQIANVKLIRADGATLFDASDSATNVTWRKHQDYKLGYKGNVLDASKFGNIENIRNNNSNKFGLVQLTMDEELMHGATIQITYTVKVTNVGEVDYYNNYGGNIMQDRSFYYTGEKSSNAKVVTTRVDQVLDYVANNLQFNVGANGNWHTIEQNKIKSDGLVNEKLSGELENYNTIISTEQLNKELVPVLADKNNASASVPLVLTQLITSENDTDDLTYRNIVEIVKTSNTVGRRMEFSVVGNQNPTEKPAELDSDMSEIVRILPPFGSVITPYIIIAITIAGVALLAVGIIFIKKKVLNK